MLLKQIVRNRKSYYSFQKISQISVKVLTKCINLDRCDRLLTIIVDKTNFERHKSNQL